MAGASGSDNGFSTGQFIARAILQKKQQGQVDDVLIIGRKGSVESVGICWRPPCGGKWLTYFRRSRNLPLGSFNAPLLWYRLPQDPKKQKTIKEFEAMGGRYVGVDYGNVDELANVLKGCDCVVSAVSVQDATAIKSGEIALAYAAAQAGVKRFIPSQFGPDDEMLPVKLRENEVYFRKKAVLDLVKELGMEWTVVITGFYMNCLFSEFICGWSDKGGQIKANVVGDGSPWVMGSAREDVGDGMKRIGIRMLNFLAPDRLICRSHGDFQPRTLAQQNHPHNFRCLAPR